MKDNKDAAGGLSGFIERYYPFFLIAVLALGCFNLFYCLKQTPIYSWDEARHGVSAYEMLKRHEYIVNTYGYKNDYWNLKPPLSFWAIMLGYRIAGFNTLGLRLFSAVAALLTIIVSSLFVKHKHGAAASMITGLVLATSPKYIVIHNARTGDADSLFVFFFTAAVLSMLMSERNIHWLYIGGFFFSLAFLTKSWHAGNIALIMFFYLLLTGKISRLKPGEWAKLAASSTLLIIIWVSLRYYKDGFTFFNAMLHYDLFTRTATTLEGHIGDRLFYYKVLTSYYSAWLLLLGLSMITSIILYRKTILGKVRGEQWKYAMGMFLWIALPFALFTAAKTKIGWYILPLYPPLAICTGAFCGALFSGPKRNIFIQIMLIFLIAVGTVRYETIIGKHILIFKNESKRVSFQYFKPDIDIGSHKAYISYIRPYTKFGPKSELKDWEQSDLLSAELYWDILPMDGGLSGFLKEESRNAVLIMPKDEITEYIAEKYGFRIIGRSNSIYILGK